MGRGQAPTFVRPMLQRVPLVNYSPPAVGALIGHALIPGLGLVLGGLAGYSFRNSMGANDMTKNVCSSVSTSITTASYGASCWARRNCPTHHLRPLITRSRKLLPNETGRPKQGLRLLGQMCERLGRQRHAPCQRCSEGNRNGTRCRRAGGASHWLPGRGLHPCSECGPALCLELA